jgi:hypothetical protein
LSLKTSFEIRLIPSEDITTSTIVKKLKRKGGLPWLDQIREIVQPEMSWDDQKLLEEAAEYTLR